MFTFVNEISLNQYLIYSTVEKMIIDNMKSIHKHSVNIQYNCDYLDMCLLAMNRHELRTTLRVINTTINKFTSFYTN